jgi:hypothetical protein
VVGHAPAVHAPQFAVVVAGEEIAQATTLDPLLAHGQVRGVLLAEQGAGAVQPAAHLLAGYAHGRPDLGIVQALQLPPQEEAARASGHTGCRRPDFLAQVSPLYPSSRLGLALIPHDVLSSHPYGSHAEY